MHITSTATAWLVSIALMAGVAATSWFLGDAASLTVAKTAIVPLYLLATKGLQTYFPDNAAVDANMWEVAKFQFAAAARMVMDFIWMTALIGGALTGISWLQQKRRNNAK